MNVLISIGNSDDKLPQKTWSDFIKITREFLHESYWRLKFHGEWFSAPDQPWQNANWLVEVDADDLQRIDDLKQQLRVHAAIYNQDSIAWTMGQVEFLEADYSTAPGWLRKPPQS